MARPCRLRLEQLEDRTLPATFGIPWPDPGRLTLSFVPDGTKVGNQQSQLFQLLNSIAPTQTWQSVILQAFQTWAAPTNINLTVVADGGDPLGTTGPLQGDPRFGDIRISAVPLPPDLVALAIPFDPTAGSWAGDVELNSNYLFGIGGSGQYDLFSTALHEAGHAFGIDGSTDPASPMYETFDGTKTSLTPGDVAAIESLYGARTPDAFDAASRNDTLATATSLNLSSGGNGLQPTVVNANLDTAADTDVFVIKPGNNQTSLTILVQTSGISLLAPRLTVYSPSQTVINSVTAADLQQGDLSVRLSDLQAGASYYLAVSAGPGDIFGAGSYRLQVVPDGVSPAAGAPPGTAVVLPDDQHTNDTLGTATDLRQNAFRTDASYAYACRAGISDSIDVDYYHLLSPQGANGTTTAMRVLVWGTIPGGLDPAVSVFDAHGNPLDSQVLVNENGSCVVQVADALPNADYYVAVRGEQTEPLHVVGNYFLGVTFSNNPVSLQTYIGGTLTQSSSTDVRTLQVNQAQLFHFVLNVGGSQAPTGTAVTMTIFDQSGNVVSTLTVASGDTQSLTVFLAPGTYAVRISGSTLDGSPLSSVSYSLSGLAQSDPIVATTNPTLSPATSSTTTSLDYYWLLYGYFAFL